MKLYKRKIFARIQKLIVKEKGLVLQGARRVGKTSVLLYVQDWLIKQGKRTVFYDLADPSAPPEIIADLAAKGINGEEPVYVLIDNWREAAAADLPKNIHLIGAGAIKTQAYKTVEILPLSFDEWLEFKGIESGQGKRWPELYREFITYGGFPEVVIEPVVEKKKQLLWQIVDLYLRKDLQDLAKIKDPAKFYRLLSVLAGRTSQMLDMMALTRELQLSFPTLKKYLEVLEKTFLVQTVRPYSRRPGNEISKNPKLYFIDSGLQSLLWLKNFAPAMLEPVFKTSVFSELIKKAGREAVSFWRTKAGAEVDFIVSKGETVLAIETTINFQGFNPKDITYFKRHYNPKRWRVIGLEGEKLARNGFYPWEM